MRRQKRSRLKYLDAVTYLDQIGIPYPLATSEEAELADRLIGMLARRHRHTQTNRPAHCGSRLLTPDDSQERRILKPYDNPILLPVICVIQSLKASVNKNESAGVSGGLVDAGGINRGLPRGKEWTGVVTTGQP